MIISYKEEDRSRTDSSSVSAVSYSLEYFSSFDPTMRRVTIAFVIMNILAFVVIGVRFSNYTLRNPKSAMKHEAVKNQVFKLFYHALDSWSEIIFWLLFFSSASIFITFKLSANPTLLLPELGAPSEKVYAAFNVVLTMVLVARSVAVLMRVGE